MTREEQIIEAGIDYTMSVRPMCIGGINFEKEIKEFNRNKSFEEGAKWADEHPKEGLVSIEKAAEWVKNSFKGTLGEVLAENIKQEFIKTMTE